MRLHKKPWAEPELENSAFFIDPPEEHRGHWRELFARPEQPLHLEIGCGKCVQAAAAAQDQPGVNFIAFDEVRKVLAVGCRVVRAAFGGDDPENLKLVWGEAGTLGDFIAPEDGVERIYISFPNPWDQRTKQHKKRLTHPRQLAEYRSILKDGGEIWFKTDDVELFETSVNEYFPACGFAVTYRTDDLAASGFTPNYVSEHERMFMEEGKAIRFVIAKMEPMTDEQMAALGLKRREVSRTERHGWYGAVRQQE